MTREPRGDDLWRARAREFSVAPRTRWSRTDLGLPSLHCDRPHGLVSTGSRRRQRASQASDWNAPEKAECRASEISRRLVNVRKKVASWRRRYFTLSRRSRTSRPRQNATPKSRGSPEWRWSSSRRSSWKEHTRTHNLKATRVTLHAWRTIKHASRRVRACRAEDEIVPTRRKYAYYVDRVKRRTVRGVRGRRG